jgi:hypothetical protein
MGSEAERAIAGIDSQKVALQSFDKCKDQTPAVASWHPAQRPALSADAAKARKRGRESRSRSLLSPTSHGVGIHADQWEP